MPVLAFFGVATVVGLLLGGVVRLRLRAAARSGASDADTCELRQASRITSAAVLASLIGLAAAALAVLAL